MLTTAASAGFNTGAKPMPFGMPGSSDFPEATTTAGRVGVDELWWAQTDKPAPVAPPTTKMHTTAAKNTERRICNTDGITDSSFLVLSRPPHAAADCDFSRARIHARVEEIDATAQSALPRYVSTPPTVFHCRNMGCCPPSVSGGAGLCDCLCAQRSQKKGVSRGSNSKGGSSSSTTSSSPQATHTSFISPQFRDLSLKPAGALCSTGTSCPFAVEHDLEDG